MVGALVKSVKVLVAFLSDAKVVYYLAYISLAVLGMIQPLFYAFHLSEIVLRFPTL